MARYWRMLPVLGFFDCSWAECDVDRGRTVATKNMLEHPNLRLEGYFRALYVPLSGSKTRMENAPSMKFYISMFNDKPPLLWHYCNHTTRGGGAFSYFLASVAAVFSYFLASAAGAFSSAFSSFLAFFFHFLFFLRLFLQLFLLS